MPAIRRRPASIPVTPAASQVYENPLPKENALHSMEADGRRGDLVQHRRSERHRPDQGDRKDETGRRKLVVVTPYPGMEPRHIAVTAWNEVEAIPVTDLHRKRIVDFIEAHSKRFNPEGF